MVKKQLFLCATFAACVTAWAGPVSRQDAQSVAKAFMFSRGISMQTEKTPYRAPRKVAAQTADENAYYYVFNAGNDKGYVIVSGDDRTEQILGYTDHGTFNEENIPENMRSWLQFYADQIKYLDDNNIQLDGEAVRAKAKARRITKTRHFVPALITSRWDQGEPYNLACPDYYKEDGTKGRPAAGCVATAIAQVMNFYRYPEKTKTSIPSLTNTYTVKLSTGATTKKTVTSRLIPKGTAIDWDNMCDRYRGGETEEQRMAVANLMLYCGQMVEMGYGASSGAVTSKCKDGLIKYFGYDDGAYHANRGDYLLDDWIDLLYSEISTGHPVIYSGNSSGGGHAFVLDGFDGENLFHVNWGWSGGSDGWFLVTILNPGDNSGIGATTSSDGYSMGQYFVAGLRLPDNIKAKPQSCMTINDVTVNKSTVKGNFINWTGAVHSFYGGMMVWNEETQEAELIKGTQQTIGELSANTYKGLSFNLRLKLPEGTHRVSPASRYSTANLWYPKYNFKTDYIEAVVDANGETTLRIVSPIEDVRIDTIMYMGNCVVNEEQEVKVFFTNLGDEFNHQFHLFASKTDEKVYTKSHGPLMLRKGESGALSFFFTPNETGKYNIWLCRSDDGSREMAHDNVQIVTESQGKKASLRVNAITIQNAVSGVVYSNRLKGTMTIRNQKNTPYEGKVKIQIWEQGANNSGTYYSGASTTVPISVSGSRNVSVPFDFENLKYDRHYYIVAYYVGQSGNLDNGGLWINDHQYKPNKGAIFWKTNGVIGGAATKTLYSTPSTAIGVYLDQTTVKTLRPNSNPNTIYAFSEASTLPSVLSEANLVVGSEADTIRMTDGNVFFSPVNFTARHATFTHEFPIETDGSGWATFTLPFAAQHVMVDSIEYELNNEHNHFWVYEFAALGNNNEVIFEPVTELRSNTPYIIAADKTMAGRSVVFWGDSVSFSKTDAVKYLVSSRAFNFYGTVVQTSVKSSYILNEGGTAFVLNEESQALPPLGTYFTCLLGEEERPAEIQLPPVPESVPDAISLLRIDQKQNPLPTIYDLSGRKVTNAQLRKGIYIINGKQVLIR